MEFDGPWALHLPGMSVELTMLAFALVLALVQLLIASRMNNGQRGVVWNLGPRDGEPPPVGKVAARMERARRNYMETFPIFAATILALAVLFKHNAWTVYASEIFVVARVLYVPLYAFGVYGLRTLVWLIATVALVILVIALFLAQ
jgi:uncharacterized MAPEG superfamily protein